MEPLQSVPPLDNESVHLNSDSMVLEPAATTNPTTDDEEQAMAPPTVDIAGNNPTASSKAAREGLSKNSAPSVDVEEPVIQAMPMSMDPPGPSTQGELDVPSSSAAPQTPPAAPIATPVTIEAELMAA